MKTSLKTLLIMAIGLFGAACSARVPQGKLTYCSYAESGSAGLGKDYCELIADPGTTPKVVVALKLGNRFGEPEIRAEYPVGQEVVDSLQAMLAAAKVYKLDGYRLDEPISGGYAYRIYQEYDSGQKVDARWYGHHVKNEALSAYSMIERFFTPWREKAIREEKRVVRCEVVINRVAGRGIDHYLMQAGEGFQPMVVIDRDVDNRFGKEEFHDQFDISDEQVKELQEKLLRLHARDLGDYRKDDALEGGTIYTVTLEYDPGDRQELYWHSRDVDPRARAILDTLVKFFKDLIQ